MLGAQFETKLLDLIHFKMLISESHLILTFNLKRQSFGGCGNLFNILLVFGIDLITCINHMNFRNCNRFEGTIYII